jgi:putative OPT family oligopeptide transporter
MDSSQRPELTARALVCGMLVAAIIGGSYPYVVLKLGFGPNISVVSAFFGYLFVVTLLRRKNWNRWENNIVQTAGTAAGCTSFLCVLLAAYDLLNQKPELGVSIHLSFWQIFCWLVVAGGLGVLMGVPMRRHFIDEEQLPYPDGIAAAETLMVLDAGGSEARRRAQALGWGAVAALVVTWFRDGWPRIKAMAFLAIPENWYLGGVLHAQKLNLGINWSLLSFGSGLLVGFRITLSMAIGMVISWVILPPLLLERAMVDAINYRAVLRWVMWPATGMMVAGGLTALALRGKSLVRTFTSLSAKSVGDDEFPMRWVAFGCLGLSAALIVIQKMSLGIPAWQTMAAIVVSVPLMLVSLRVFGETNWGPISTMGNMMQAVFAFLAPGQIAANMAASGMAASIVSESEGIMQDYKCGKIVGSNNRHLTYAQLLAIPVGAAVLAWVYPVLVAKYGVGGETGLSAPTAVKWAGFAEILSKGFGALPPGCFTAFLAASAAGVVLTVLGNRWKAVPSASAVGLGMLLPGVAVLSMLVGGIADLVWRKRSPKTAEELMTPLASGFIAGEAILAVIIPILMVLGLLAG